MSCQQFHKCPLYNGALWENIGNLSLQYCKWPLGDTWFKAEWCPCILVCHTVTVCSHGLLFPESKVPPLFVSSIFCQHTLTLPLCSGQNPNLTLIWLLEHRIAHQGPCSVGALSELLFGSTWLTDWQADWLTDWLLGCAMERKHKLGSLKSKKWESRKSLIASCAPLTSYFLSCSSFQHSWH